MSDVFNDYNIFIVLHIILHSVPGETVCHLLLVSVRKKYRNLGMGRFLINASID